ncbi:YsnF/AvaK domain-containing protein [Hymenobacter psychrophilus]|uniref:Conserved domain-containing protein n=1 Tax=Hymenobacter psychrophilus TaxID=651662 RepID=A0A1H3M5T3_9BACT|nr:YsnF/AvaK domain-containing protein [Hymenobacter psychrophilus]SDY71569.1 conserved domain-containing protein [Hymenobacter psychrophilus]
MNQNPMNQTVVGIFDTAAHAKQAAQQLKTAGFSLDDVDTISRDSKDGSNYYNSTNTTTEAVGDAAGRTSDSIGNFFHNLFGNDGDNANLYSHAARNSNSLVTVHCKTADHAHKAAEILDRAGAIDVNEKAGQTGYKANNMASGSAATTQTGNNEVSAKVIEENLQVGKRVEQTGGARLRSRIVERPVEANVRLREEHVNVERTAVNRPATEADFNAFKEGEVEVTERTERAVVGKEARVVEEVTLGKEVTEREETIRDTVRKTEVDVEQLGTKDVRNDNRKNS